MKRKILTEEEKAARREAYWAKLRKGQPSIHHSGVISLGVGEHYPRIYDVCLNTGRIRRTLCGWITWLHETRDTGFARVYCTDKRCSDWGTPHEHLACLG